MSVSVAASAKAYVPAMRATEAPARLPVFDFDSLIIGGGPAGLAPLIAACRMGRFDEILTRGIAIVEAGPAIGAGKIGGYGISSDSTAETLVSCIHGNPHPLMTGLRDHPVVQEVAGYGAAAVPLALVGEMLNAVGHVLQGALQNAEGCRTLLGYMAVHTQQMRDGTWRTLLRRVHDGASHVIRSRIVVLATGGYQPVTQLESYRVGGVPLLPRYSATVLQSDDALSGLGFAAIRQRLDASPDQSIAIIGSSSSALACAKAVLRLKTGQRPSVRSLTLLHRRPLRLFYSSAEAAFQDGYTDFGPDDICPRSGFVYRFAGFRLESRELAMAALGIGGRKADPRLHLHRLTGGADAGARTILDQADLIISALGYRPRALQVLATEGETIPLHADRHGEAALVDGRCRVMDASGVPIEGLFGIGLAAGYRAPETNGGEPSFRGQTNGIWQWQNDIGAMIAHELAGNAVDAAQQPAFSI